MSLSKECQEYHLTPKGWIEGTFYKDNGAAEEIAPPADRVSTISCYDELASAFSKPSFRNRVDWESEDKPLLDKLKKKYGKHPDWFGYKQQS